MFALFYVIFSFHNIVFVFLPTLAGCAWAFGHCQFWIHGSASVFVHTHVTFLDGGGALFSAGLLQQLFGCFG